MMKCRSGIKAVWELKQSALSRFNTKVKNMLEFVNIGQFKCCTSNKKTKYTDYFTNFLRAIES